jgi:signal transduction histidine kinase/ActR/RegA family two-component response regulator
MITVPLSHGQRLMGALTLCFGRSGRSHTRQDVALAEEIARRAAFAVEHARLYQEAARANRAKDVFLGVVSHELRTPLTAILGWSSVLEGPARRRMHDIDEPLRVIHQSAVALTRLVDDILDVSRVIAGKLEISREPLALASVITSAHETVRQSIEEKQIQIELVSSSDGLVLGDAQRLRQVVINLLTNAVKFTPQGGKIAILLRNEGTSVVLEVRDNGRGIERDELVGVFDAFRQIDSSTTRSHGGLGLGLAIVRQLIELHGGRVRAESDGIGLGARFVVELPRATQNVFAVEPLSRSEDTGSRLDGMRVLVVDDQSDARELTAAVLRRYGAHATTAISAAEAISLFESARPDVILSDIGMPLEDGYSLITRLRDLERQRGIARTFAAAFTAYAGAADRARALEVGYDLHLPKPIEPSELVSRLAACVARARRRSA